jgi:penicillin-binding protein 2
MSVFGSGWKGPGTPSRTRPHGNLTALRVAVLVLFGLLAAQLFRMQIVDGEEYARRSRENHITREAVLPPRGLIYDRNGELLVENAPMYAATVVPELLPGDVSRRHAMFLQLEEIIGVPALEMETRVQEAEAKGTPYIEITLRGNLSREQALRLEEAAVDMPGVRLAVRPGRHYPAGPEFSHILGYIGDQTAEEYRQLRERGYLLNEPVGKAGVEARYEADLRGTRGIIAAEQDAHGYLVRSFERVDPVPGNSIRLSVDAALQRYVTSLLEDNLAGTDARLGDATTAGAVVMDAESGAIYALASVPTYDNNIFMNLEQREAEYRALLQDERRPLLNNVLNPAAPGSTFKLLTAAAALDVGNITPSTGRDIPSRIYEIKGENGQIYELIDWRAHGYVNLYSAIAYSSNLYFFQASCGILGEIPGIARDAETSATTLAYYARAFGFGQPTGIDIGGDAAGVVPDPAWKRRVHANDPVAREWYYYDTCAMAIGQGDMLATPLQIAVMTAAIANGGTVVTPHVADAVISPTGSVVRTIETPKRRVPVDDSNLAHIRRGMAEAVSYGAGELAGRYGVTVWGKTGTAEYKRRLPSGEWVDSEHAWFTGFTEWKGRPVVVTVYFDVGMGGAKAAPVAGQILSYFVENMR